MDRVAEWESRRRRQMMTLDQASALALVLASYGMDRGSPRIEDLVF